MMNIFPQGQQASRLWLCLTAISLLLPGVLPTAAQAQDAGRQPSSGLHGRVFELDQSGDLVGPLSGANWNSKTNRGRLPRKRNPTAVDTIAYRFRPASITTSFKQPVFAMRTLAVACR